ncbi:carboxymuconolactone decarboxylase family protein [Gimesia sp.]|uniref:carboxymuconolactone decarboxylase family protein n=1 Tax=Gimesia sp. TaxID=2024833 RepID=UPI003A8D75A6
MPRLTAVNPATVTGPAKALLDGVQSKLGMTPNLMRTMAHSPAVLDAYLKFSGTLTTGALSAQHREQISLTVGEANHCEYCVSAHSALGKRAGLSPTQILENRAGVDSDPATAALLKFSRTIVAKRGQVSDQDLQDIRDAGFSEEQIAEIAANVALNIFTNYFNNIARTEIDFPTVEPLPAGLAAANSW